MDFPEIKVDRVLRCRDCVHCNDREKNAYCYLRKALVKADARACKHVDVQRRRAE